MTEADQFLTRIRQRNAFYEQWRTSYLDQAAMAHTPRDLYEVIAFHARELGFEYSAYSRRYLSRLAGRSALHFCNFDPTGSYPDVIARRLAKHWEFRVDQHYIHGWTKSARHGRTEISVLSMARNTPVREDEMIWMEDMFDWLTEQSHTDMTHRLHGDPCELELN